MEPPDISFKTYKSLTWHSWQHTASQSEYNKMKEKQLYWLTEKNELVLIRIQSIAHYLDIGKLRTSPFHPSFTTIN